MYTVSFNSIMIVKMVSWNSIMVQCEHMQTVYTRRHQVVVMPLGHGIRDFVCEFK